MNQAASPTAFLRDLIAFKTISGSQNISLIEYLENWAQKHNFAYQRITHPKDSKRANLLCWAGPACEGGLMLSGHTDVVPVASQDWKSDPFLLYEHDNKLFGRGTADMKGFIAATCTALSSFDLKKLKKPLSLLFTYDEETGCEGSRIAARLLKNILPAMPKAAIIGEPTDFSIRRMHSGHVTLKIKALGKGAHSSNPSLGISAIRAMNHVLTGLFMLEEELKQEESFTEYFSRPYVALNVGSISGGSAVNIIPDEAQSIIGFRPLPETSIDKIIERIKYITEKASDLTGAKIIINKEQITPPMITKAGSKLEQIIMPHAQKNSQAAAAFSTDAGNLSHAGIECLIYGPGSIDIAHQANEFITKLDLELAVKKISKIIENYLT